VGAAYGAAAAGALACPPPLPVHAPHAAVNACLCNAMTDASSYGQFVPKALQQPSVMSGVALPAHWSRVNGTQICTLVHTINHSTITAQGYEEQFGSIQKSIAGDLLMEGLAGPAHLPTGRSDTALRPLAWGTCQTTMSYHMSH